MLTVSMVPMSVFAQSRTMTARSNTNGDIYTIQNDYVRYSINAKTGGFSVETLDGNPQKYLDDKIPLLYREDETRSNGTSFTTIRIDGRDYIFGRDYNHYGITTKLETPVISNDGRLLTVSWKIKDYTVLQQVALSAEQDMDLTGNVGISYTVLNNSSSDAVVGIRVLLDSALDSTVDAPYLMTDTSNIPLKTEVEFSKAKGNLPSQIRGLDSVSNPSKMLYTFTKTWNNDAAEVDRIIVGHWRNLANTRYTYIPDAYCDFTNYSNTHMTPDAAIAYYWDEATLAAGASRTAELLYGVGNFTSSVIENNIGIDMVINNKITLNDAGTGYNNDGKFSVTVTLDNSVDNATLLEDAILTVSFEDGITALSNATYAFDQVPVGEIKVCTVDLQVEPQSTITGKVIGATLTASKEIDADKAQIVTVNADRTLVVPGVKGPFAGVTVSSVAPAIVYTEGTKSLTVTGNLAALKAINGTDGWELKLYHTTTDHTVTIDHNRVAFLGDAYSQISFTTDKELVVGEYEIGFVFSDTQLVDGFGCVELRFDKTFQVSNDPLYKTRNFGLIALIRYNTRNYTYVPFADRQEYDNFFNGKTKYGAVYDSETNNVTTSGYLDIEGKPIAPFAPVDKNDPNSLKLNEKEVLLVMQAPFHEVLNEDGSVLHYEARPEDGDILINEILKYTGSESLIVAENDGIYTVEGEGRLQVVSSIDVWKGPWSFQVNNGTVTSLDASRYGLSNANDLELTLGGVGYMVQSIGGFLIDLKYGVMSSSCSVQTDRTQTYGISFGGSISIPIMIPSSSKKDAGNGDQGDQGGTGGSTPDPNPPSGGDNDPGDSGSAGSTGGVEGSNTGSKKAEAEKKIKQETEYLGEDFSEDFANLFAGDEEQYVEHKEESKPRDKFHKDTNLDDSALSVAIDSILYGQKTSVKDGHTVIDDIGFIGIDTTVSLGLPKDTLGKLINNAPGVRASLTINTIDHFYMLEAGLDIKMIQCEGVLSFMMTEVKGKDIVVPDSIQFYIRDGLKIPLDPFGVLFISGLGGGFEGLADTIGGEFSKLPPLTILAYMRLDVMELLIGDYNVGLSLTGISFDGEYSINVAGMVKSKPTDGGTGGDNNSGGNNNTGDQGGTTGGNNNTGNQGGTTDGNNNTGDQGGTTGGNNNAGDKGGTTGINGAKDSKLNPANVTKFATTIIDTLMSPVSIKYGASARWIDPLCFTGYGNITVIGGLLSGGVSITIGDQSFYGYAYLSLCIPDDVPIIGGHELAGVEAAITDKYIGANLKIIGISFGFIYYWSGDFNYGTGIKLRGGPMMVQYPDYSSTAVYATNLSKVEKEPVPTKFRMARAAVVPQTIFYDFSGIEGKDSLVLEIPFTSSEIPTVNDIIVTNPDGTQITLTPDDGQGGGSFLVQVTENGSFIYVSVTDSALIKDGTWTIAVKQPETAEGEEGSSVVSDLDFGEFDIYGVEAIPELKTVTVSHTDKNSHDLTVDWTLTNSSSGSGYLNVYLTKDKNLLDQIKSDDTKEHDLIALERISLEAMDNGSRTVKIPEAMESGTYYVVGMLTNDVGGMSTAITTTTFDFVNLNLPKPVQSVSASYAGNGELFVKVVDAAVAEGQTLGYTDYLVEVYDVNGNAVPNTMQQFGVDEDIYVGGEDVLVPGQAYTVRVKTLREADNNYFYGTDIIASAPITMPTVEKPVLISVKSNFENGIVNGESFEITYTFDRPVWMYTEINQITLCATEFRKSWTFKADLNDGDYIVDFVAYGQNKDSVTGRDFPNIANAQMGFTIDSVAPSLSVKQYEHDSIAGKTAASEKFVFASSVVYADANGNFTVEGFTDHTAQLTANGEAVTVSGNGMFAYTGTLSSGETSREILLRAVDPAGNATELAVTVVAGAGSAIERVEILYNGNHVEKNEKGEPVISVLNGARGTLSLVGYTADGKTVSVEDVQWDILSEKNNIVFDNGSFTARATGETAIKAGISFAEIVLADGTKSEVRCEDYVILQIEAGDKDKLYDALLEAEETYKDPKQAEPDVIADYRAVIDQAKALYIDDTTPEDAFGPALADLIAATEAFKIARVINKDALKALVAEAEANIIETYIATEDEIAAYRAAIDEAAKMCQNDDATKQEVADAEAAMKAATEAFDAVKIVNKDELKALIAEAEANIATPMQAPDEAIAAYRAAIDAAAKVSVDDYAVKDVVAAAIAALNEATAAFNEAKIVDKSALETAITKAEANIAKPMGAEQSAIDTYRAAIDAAIAVFENENAKAVDIAAAITALNEATAAFNAAKAVDKSALLAEIELAEQSILDTKYASLEDTQAFRDAIDAAKAVYADKVSTQKTVDAAVSALKQAAERFEEVKNKVSTILVPIYHITVKDTENGTVSVSNQVLYAGMTLTITSKPDKYYAVETVKINGRDFGAEEVITIEAIAENLTVEVTFKCIWKNPFNDVSEDDWFYPYVAWACINDITSGTSENTFSPHVSLTRAMLVTFLWRAEGCPAAQQKTSFVDVADGMYYTDAIAWASENGIVMGYTDGTFGPDDIITREQIAVVMYRTAVYRGEFDAAETAADLADFTDAASVSDYAVEGMRWAVGSGLIIGNDGKLNPRGDASRAESVTILSRFFEEE